MSSADVLYKIEFFDEWHCGTGQSSGVSADALVIRDIEGLPFVPGRTLKGLLRDAAVSLTELSGQAPEGAQFIRTVFGWQDDRNSNQSDSGVCRFTSASVTGTVRADLRDDPTRLAALFHLHSTTAIDSKGQAKPHTLRTTESVVPLTLFAKISHVPPDHLDELIRCMAWVKRLGGHRNRGWGRCQFTIIKP